MGDIRFDFETCGTVQTHVRKGIEEETGPTVMEAYDEAVRQLAAQAPVGHPAGFYVTAGNTLKRIPNSIPYGQGVPREVPDKIAKPLSLATVEAVDVDDVPEPELAALPSPVMEVTDNPAHELRELLSDLDTPSDPDGDESDDSNSTDMVTPDGEDGHGAE